MESMKSYVIRDQKQINQVHQSNGAEHVGRVPVNLWKTLGQNPVPPQNLHFHSGSFLVDERRNNFQPENGLYSSSFSEIFSRKLRLSPDTADSNKREDEPFELSEEIEAQTIGDLLPGDDELLSGVIDDLDYTYPSSFVDDTEDDFFCSVGGIELDNDDDGLNCFDNCQQGVLGVPFAGEHPCGEHPSRTLFVRNINSNVEDAELRTLFEQFGDIRNIYAACKHRGFVMISYYDIRSARNAMRALQNKPLRRRKLDIHFSIPKDNPSDKDVNQGTLVAFNLDSSVSNDEIRKIFGAYGEIKEIRETPHKHHHKFIEFYDVRAAEAALRGLNRSDIAGKRIKLEPSRPGGTRRSSQQLPSDIDSEDSNSCVQIGSSPLNESTLGSAQHASRGFESGPFQELISGVHPLMMSAPIRVPPSTVSHNSGFQPQLPIHPHSLSDFHDGGSGIDRHPVPPRRLGSLGSTNEGGFGSTGNGSCPLHGPPPQYVWGGSSSPYRHVWSNSPSGVNPIHASPQFGGFSRVNVPPPHVLSPILPLHQQPHVGSAPAVNPSPWDWMQQAGFRPGSLGSDPPSQAAVVFPPHLLYGRSSSVAVAAALDVAVERGRPRRGDAAAAPMGQLENKRQYELDLEKISSGQDSRTTLMIKNIPNKYTSKMLLASIDERHRGTYDFIYLPIDFKNKCNVGYAFINMVDPLQIIPFFQTFNGKKWEKFNSEKVASLAYARIQGKQALVAHFQNSSLMNEDKRCRPILFHTDGPHAGDQEPFPMGINIRARPGRPRPAASDDNTLQGSPKDPGG
ncbi:protein MEI2-like 4 [Wolffia australiana]